MTAREPRSSGGAATADLAAGGAAVRLCQVRLCAVGSRPGLDYCLDDFLDQLDACGRAADATGRRRSSAARRGVDGFTSAVR